MRPSLEERIALACRLNGELPLQPLGDRPALETTEREDAIPAQCFQTAEINRFGRNHHATLIDLRARNPDFHFLLFDAARRDAYMATHWGDHPISRIYQRARFGAMRADIFRYCVIFDLGGFYLDINKLLMKPLRKFLREGCEGLISFEQNWCQIPASPEAARQLLHPDRYIVQWCFGFSPEHRLLKAMIENICHYAPLFENRTFEMPGEAIRSLTGPGLFTQTVRHYMGSQANKQITQMNIDFNGELRFPTELEVMYFNSPHYNSCRQEPIFIPAAVRPPTST